MRFQRSEETLNILKAHSLHRKSAIALELARVLPGHRLPQRLRAGRIREPVTPRQRDQMARTFIIQALRLVLGRAHPERPGLKPAKTLLGPAVLRCDLEISIDAELRVQSEPDDAARRHAH